MKKWKIKHFWAYELEQGIKYIQEAENGEIQSIERLEDRHFIVIYVIG